jgi:hypothetical protein
MPFIEVRLTLQELSFGFRVYEEREHNHGENIFNLLSTFHDFI